MDDDRCTESCSKRARALWRMAIAVVITVGCSETPAPVVPRQQVEMTATSAPAKVGLGVPDLQLADASIACATCHGTAQVPGFAEGAASPHGGIELHHGNLGCNACHDDPDRSRLRLADATTLPMSEAMTLCGQCHGSKLRDYQRGAHGGMRGYWDETLGPKTRNSCLSCHGPHAPAYPTVQPAPGPRDRQPLAAAVHDSTIP